ncbi:hypothetical protein GUT184_04400 [Streptococcus ruminantium]|nr:hypothetical protein GUT184_04400 [Streptococcus ruminantium]
MTKLINECRRIEFRTELDCAFKKNKKLDIIKKYSILLISNERCSDIKINELIKKDNNK